jgi:hypothetical protein
MGPWVRWWLAVLFLLSLAVAATVGLIYGLPTTPSTSDSGGATPPRDADSGASPSDADSGASPSDASASPSDASTSPSDACSYTLIEDARPWGCRPKAPSTYATAAEARAACSAAGTCKGYYRAPPGYAIASFLPSECLASATAADTPVEFHAKPGHVKPSAQYAPQGAWKAVKGTRVGSCGASLGSETTAQHNSTYRICAESDEKSERCAYFASGYLDPAMCVLGPEPTYSSFVPKRGSGFGPAQTKTPAVVASCAFRLVRDESDAKCLCAADPKCAGYYRGASGHALSVAEPEKCEVDWQLNKATIEKAKDKCSLLGPKWATNATYEEKYCVPVGTCAWGTNEVLCTDLNGPPCPAGWTVEGNSCRPPCPRERGTGGWCVMSRDTAQPCPRGFQKFKKAWHGLLCVPTAPDIERIVQSAAA